MKKMTKVPSKENAFCHILSFNKQSIADISAAVLFALFIKWLNLKPISGDPRI